MRFSVSVPVLSAHSTVVAPSVSMAGNRRVSTPWREMRQAPRARNTVRTTGNSSGSSAMASVRPARAAATSSPCRAKCSSATPMHAASAKTAMRRTRRDVSRSRKVLPASTVASDAPMRPNSERAPVATTSPVAVPRTTSVPAYACRSRPSPSTCLSAGTDSPVSSDSSTRRPCASTSIASAATRSPSRSRSRSPRTTSRPAMRCSIPSRITSARGLERSRRASSASSVRRSWITVIATITTIDAASTNASRRSPTVR